MRDHARSLLFSLLFMLPPDAAWLAVMGRAFYAPRIGHLMADSPSLLPAAFFYLLYALGLSVFVVVPAVRGRTPLPKVFALGALLGLVAYGTYDLTNQATLWNWPIVVTLVDLAWGGCLTGAVAVAAAFILGRQGSQAVEDGRGTP
jgi:uncharacterized membrane protein